MSAAAPVPPTASSLGQQVVELRYLAAAVPDDADADLVVGAADPVELGTVELRSFAAEQWVEAGAAPNRAEHEPFLGGDVVKPVGESQAAGTIHVLRGDDRIARNVIAEMAGDQAGVDIVAAADAVADHQVDGLALVEVRLRMRWWVERTTSAANAARADRQGASTGSPFSEATPSLASALPSRHAANAACGRAAIAPNHRERTSPAGSKPRRVLGSWSCQSNPISLMIGCSSR